jgi:hypothetical protein
MTPKKVQKSMNYLLKQLPHIKVTSGDSPHIDQTQSGWNPVHNKQEAKDTSQKNDQNVGQNGNIQISNKLFETA